MAFLVSSFLIPSEVSAIMHMGTSNSKVQDSKAILSDEEYEKLGEKLMEAMTGENHEEMDSLGMGMLSQSGDEGTGVGSSGNMMGTNVLRHRWPLANNTQLSGSHSILVITTWIAFIAFLTAGARWFWKKAGR